MTSFSQLETLRFVFAGRQRVAAFSPQLLGVVGSGNLEVLAEPCAGDDFVVELETSARGFAAVWTAVLQDFHAQHQLAGVRFSIHDMGATPAVVGLGLRQALAQLREAE